MRGILPVLGDGKEVATLTDTTPAIPSGLCDKFTTPAGRTCFFCRFAP
jgi:hypothetical protein